MKLTEKVKNSIVRFVQNPVEKDALALIRTGTLFRYLACADQLESDIVEKLEDILKENLPKLEAKTKLTLYQALATGFVSANYLNVVLNMSAPSFKLETY